MTNMEENNRLHYKKDFTCIGKGFVDVEKVRVYHHFWGRLLPPQIKLDWNDEDAMPFILYLDGKDRMVFGSSDERHPDLFTKIESIRFNYPELYLMGRLWKKRKIIVLDQFYERNILSKYYRIDDFLEIASHYVEGVKDFNLVFKESERCNNVYMDNIIEVYDRCLPKMPKLPLSRNGKHSRLH